MARIPNDELERLKDEVSVERLVESSGIELKRSGKDKVGKCPFHEDDTPSLVVTAKRNLWHCFGCGAAGGPIDWVMKRQGVSFRHAVELLRADPSLAAQGTSPRTASTVRKLPAPVSLDADEQRLLDEAIDYYHQTLKSSPEALAYLEARGLTHPELVDRFKLGYANRTLGLRLPLKNRAAGAELRTKLQRVGVLRDTGHEHFNGSLVVPILDAEGHVVEAYGRKVRDDLRPGTPKHLYLPGPHAGLLNLAGVVEAGARRDNGPGAREVIVCEAPIDAMTFWCAGFTNVTTAYGVDGFTDGMVAALKGHGIERVLIAFDRDAAGERGAEALGARLVEAGIEALAVQFPRGMDANEYALKLKPATQALGLVLRQARWLGRGPAPVAAADKAAEEGVPAIEPEASTVEPEATPAEAEAAPTPDAPSSVAEPAPASEDVPASADAASDANADEVTLRLGVCAWRVRGWRKNTTPEQMRVNVQVRRVDNGDGGAYHVDTLDLYAARARVAFLRQASTELALPEEDLKRDLGRLLLKLELLQDEALRETRAPKATAPTMSAEAQREALALLRSPELGARIVADLQACGVVGEATNLLAGYLAATSRKLDAPLAVLIQSSSAAGKSSLMDAVLTMMPPEERIQYSAMTGQSLFYLGETQLQHKVLAIAEEEGVRQAAYALKLLQSDGELTIASTGKDEATGNLVTKQYRVQGPVMLMLTTTAIDIDEELLNRCLVLTVNESREQTRAIHARQRHKQTLDGLLASTERDALIELHRNAQRLLAPVHVVNPYADQLSFGDHQTRTRRDHAKYLGLIQSIALLHQHQREVKTIEHRGQVLAYIEVTREDIALANSVAYEVFGRTLDELPPQTRKLLTHLREWARGQAQARGCAVGDVRFTRRELREAVQWGDTQLKVHLARLVELEFVALHRHGLAHAYELLYAAPDDEGGEGQRARLCGLRDVSALKDVVSPQAHAYDSDRSGLKALRSGSGRASVGGRSGPGRGDLDRPQTQQRRGLQPDAKAANGHEHAKAHVQGEALVVAAPVVLASPAAPARPAN